MPSNHHRHKVLNLGIRSNRRPLTHGQVPGHPDPDTGTDQTSRSNLRPKQPQQSNPKRAQGLRCMRPEGNLKQPPKRPQKLHLERRIARNPVKINPQRPLTWQRARQVFRCVQLRHSFRTQPNPPTSRSARRISHYTLALHHLVYNRREQRISVGEVRLPQGPLVTASQPAVGAHP